MPFNNLSYYSVAEEAIAPTPRDEVLIDIDDKEPLIPGQVSSVSLFSCNIRPHS